MAGKVLSAANVHQLLRRYELGIYTRTEVVSAFVFAGATLDVAQLATELPGDWLTALREYTASPPRTVDDLVNISGGTYRAGFEREREAHQAEMRRLVFAGYWRWYRYFAEASAAATGASG